MTRPSSPRTPPARCTRTRTKLPPGTVRGGASQPGRRLGVLFPPSVLGAAAVGGVIGGVSGHLAKGMSRSRAKELGDFIDPGQAGLIVVGETTIESAIQEAVTRADKQTIEDLDVKPEGHRQDLAGNRQRYVTTSPACRAGGPVASTRAQSLRPLLDAEQHLAFHDQAAWFHQVGVAAPAPGGQRRAWRSGSG